MNQNVSLNKDNRPCCYELLGVEKTASADEIRKAYLKLSLRYHPDKNPDDPAAAEKFKQISDAYSILKEQETRDLYDKYGYDMAKDMGNVDPEELFEQMFGTKDPVEAGKKILADPDLRGPVILGVGAAGTVGGIAAIYHGAKSLGKKGETGKGLLSIGGGLLGTAAGLVVGVGGAATWGVDAAIKAGKKGVNSVEAKIKESKERKEESRRNAAQSSESKPDITLPERPVPPRPNADEQIYPNLY